MENKVLEKNIDYLSSYNKKLADKILMADIEKSNIALTKTNMDEYNLIYNNVLVHDISGAQLEADRIVSKLEDEKNTIRIVFGLGMGYLADAMAQSFKNSTIIIYEPNIDLLHFVLSIAQVDAIYQKNVVIFEDEKTLVEYIKSHADFNTKMTLSYLPSYDKKEVIKLFSAAQKALGELQANKNTFLKKAPAAIKNTVCNLKYILNNPSIEDLEGIYKDSTALIVSAGPSLADNIDILKNNQDKFVIFALNNTAQFLIKNDIKPDFIADIEAIDNSKQFESIDTKEYYFILEAFCNPKIAAFKTKKTFNYISQDNFLNPWVLECLNQKSNLNTLGTVSYTALLSAYLAGFKKIILLGSDLAYKDGKCYSKGSQYEDLECVFENEKYIIKPRDMDSFINSLKTPNLSFEKASKDAKKYLEQLNETICTVKSQTGALIPTQAGYAFFIEHFKDFALRVKGVDLINSSSKGAQIDGFKNIPLEEVIKTLEPTKKLDLSSFESKIDKKFAKEKIEQTLQKLLELDSLFEQTNSLTKKIIQELEIKKVFTQNALKLIKKQKELLKKILGYRDDKIALNLILEFLDILQKDYLSNIEDTKLLYKKLNQAKNRLVFIIKELTNCKSFVF